MSDDRQAIPQLRIPPESPEALAAQYDAQMRRLREMRNADCSKTRKLPPEILAMIFRVLSQEIYYITSYSKWPLNLTWVVVTHVCRSWRTVALTEPQLWTDLTDMPVKWAEEKLKRSKAALLQLECSNETSAVTDVVLKSPERLKFLKIGDCDDQCLSCLKSPAPFLETLIIRGRFPIPPDFLGGHAPRLSSFTSYGNVPLEAPWMSNLRKLSLDGNWTAIDGSSGEHIYVDVSTILSILRNIPYLKSLCLRSSNKMASQLRPYQGPSVYLGHLREIDILFYNHHFFLANLLSHITMKKLQTLHIRWPNVTDLTEAETLCKQMCKFFEANSKAPAEVLRYEDSQFEICGISREPCLRIVDFRHPNPGRFMTDISTGCNLRILHARVTYMPLILQESDTIEELHIFTHKAFKNLLTKKLTDAIPIPYPALRQLHITRVNLTPKSKTIPELKRWISARKKTAKLERLVINCCNLTSRDIESLQKSVAVSWDGVTQDT